MKKQILLICLLIVINVSYAQKGYIYEDKKFHQDVGVVQLFPDYNMVDQEIQFPIVSLKQQTSLLLKFDLLHEEYDELQAKIIHCNADWTKSVLNDMDYLAEFNVFDVRDFDYSFNTKALYVHYWFELPQVKVSGNYVIMVYADNDPTKVILTRRFIVFESLAGVSPTIRASTSARNRLSHQQIDFFISHTNLKVSNPYTELKVVLRQNGRWDNAITTLKPTNVSASSKRLEYRSFNAENNFSGSNEFRNFDARLFSFRGMNVSKINETSVKTDLYVILDKTKENDAHSQQLNDMNGMYFIGTNESNAGYLECDYFNAHFSLRTEEPSPHKIYVIGAFNDWQKNESNRMKFNPNNNTYQASMRLKQGVYNYLYWVDGPNPDLFENSFYQTENAYDIIVYYRGFHDQVDRVVGYTLFSSE